MNSGLSSHPQRDPTNGYFRVTCDETILQEKKMCECCGADCKLCEITPNKHEHVWENWVEDQQYCVKCGVIKLNKIWWA